MTSRNHRRDVLERQIQAEIERAIGAEPDFLLLRNSVGRARYVTDDGREYFVPYGLGVSSPDLVGILRVRVTAYQGAYFPRTVGIWLCLEVKAEGEDATDEQKKCHAIWRRFGAIVDVVHSVSGARAALERARRMFA